MSDAVVDHPIVKAVSRVSLSERIFIGLVPGIAVGLFFGESVAVLQPVADIHIRLMQMTVLLFLVIASLEPTPASHRSRRRRFESAMRSDSPAAPTRGIRFRAAVRGVLAAVCAVGSMGLAGAVRASGEPSANAATAAGDAGAPVALGDSLRPARTGGAGAGASATERLAFVPGELIVRLRPEVGRRVRSADSVEFGSAMPGSPAAAALDALLRRHEVTAFQRVFRMYEDADGVQIDTAADRLRRTRAARRLPGGRRLPPLPANPPDLENFFLVRVSGAGTFDELAPIVEELLANDLVAAVQPNFVHHVLAEPLPAVPTIPDDPYVSGDGATWSAGSFGNAFPDLYGVRNLHALEAWSLFDANGNGAFDGAETAPGEGVVVAVIDTGLDAAHPEVAGRLFENPGEVPGDGIDNDANGLVDDVSGWDFIANDPVPEDGNGHGSHVAGTILAGANNAEGIVGIAPFARVLPIKGLSDEGFGSTAGLAAAVHYATVVGAHITSNSWGSSFADEFLRLAFEFAEASGVLSFAAAGNSGRSDLAAPARFESVVSVGAVDDLDVLAPFSDWGVDLDLCAPGVNVLSLSANDHDNALVASTGRRVGDRYLWLSGTSMAAPHASGVAALVMSLHPTESAPEIRGRLMQAAADIEPHNPGREGGLGAGRVDALASAVAVPAPLLRVAGLRVGAIVAGGVTSIDVTLKNFWSAAAGVHASLSSADPDVILVVDERDFGDLDIGESATGVYEIELAPDLELGKVIDLVLTVVADGIAPQDHAFSVRGGLFVNRDDLTNLHPFPLLVVGATFGDFDGDGLQDMGVGTYFERLHLYRQQADGSFDDREPNGSGPARYPVFADMNGDGLLDMLTLGAVGGGALLGINVGGGEFELLPDSSGFRFPQNAAVSSITPIDFDADGDLDLVAGLFGVHPDDQGVFRDTVVLRNDGNLTFADTWVESGFPRTGGGRQLLTLDWNGDGFQDLLGLLGSARRVVLRRGLGDGTFEDVTGIAFPDGMLTCADLTPGRCDLFASVAAGDYDNDGDTDLLFATQSNVSADERPALRLFTNDGRGVYSDATDRAGDLATLKLLSGSWGTAFFDLENDGDLDILVPIDIVILGSPTRQPEETVVILRNDGAGHFTHVSDVAFPPDTPLASSMTVVGDYDADGAQDIFAPVPAIPGLVGGLMRNLAGRDRAWLEVELDPAGSAPNGYGARVTLEAGGRIQTREIHYSPVETWRVHFGLGDAAIVDVLEVRWPSGVVGLQRDVAVDQLFRVDEAAPCPDLADGQCATVAIDVDPKSDDNAVNPQSRKLLTVAILGSERFDATQIDVTRSFFGPGRATAVHSQGGHLVDANADGRVDLISHYRVQDTGIESGDVEACLRGQLLDRTPFSGCVAITTPTNVTPR